jgi:hypothetical protein
MTDAKQDAKNIPESIPPCPACKEEVGGPLVGWRCNYCGNPVPASGVTVDRHQTLTGAGTRAGQLAWLQREGIPCRPNGKDELLVTWAHVNAWMEGRERPASRGINWAAQNA